nr:hypothetical protein [uncultured Shinella sp.]
MLAFGVLLTAVTSIFRTLKFSSSDKAAEAAKAIDKEITPSLQW